MKENERICKNKRLLNNVYSKKSAKTIFKSKFMAFDFILNKNGNWDLIYEGKCIFNYVKTNNGVKYYRLCKRNYIAEVFYYF